MLFDVIWCYMMFHDVIRCKMMCFSVVVIWCYLMLYDVTWCDMMLLDIIACCTMLCDVIWCFVMFQCYMMFYVINKLYHSSDGVVWSYADAAVQALLLKSKGVELWLSHTTYLEHLSEYQEISNTKSSKSLSRRVFVFKRHHVVKHAESRAAVRGHGVGKPAGRGDRGLRNARHGVSPAMSWGWDGVGRLLTFH